jgi:hypothetical protein
MLRSAYLTPGATRVKRASGAFYIRICYSNAHMKRASCVQHLRVILQLPANLTTRNQGLPEVVRLPADRRHYYEAEVYDLCIHCGWLDDSMLCCIYVIAEV